MPQCYMLQSAAGAICGEAVNSANNQAMLRCLGPIQPRLAVGGNILGDARNRCWGIGRIKS